MVHIVVLLLLKCFIYVIGLYELYLVVHDGFLHISNLALGKIKKGLSEISNQFFELVLLHYSTTVLCQRK